MGVKGLKTYIENSGDVLRVRNLKNIKLIIDGSNLFYSLYFGSKLDQAHGGEYKDFEKDVTKFFRNLERCQIWPYVVLDGGDDISDKKFDTLKKRSEDRIKKAEGLTRGCSRECLPVLVKKVFKQILRKLKVPFIQCIAEADWEIAALANEWNCPVLSNDGDFFIFNIKGGFLPFPEFEWRRVRTSKATGQKFIQTKCFNVSTLCARINHMKKGLLPIFATILGNDYANLDKGILPNWSKFSVYPGGNSRIDGLLRWLSKYRSPQEAINALLIQIKNPKDSEMVRQTLYQGLQEYKLTPSSIAKFFISGDPQSKLPAPLQHLPQWFLKCTAEGKQNSILLDILTLHRVMLHCSVQDFSLASCNLTSRPIRQVIYGIMLASKPSQRNTSQASPKRGQFEVEEYDREGLELKSSKVVASLPSQVLPDLHLETMLEVPQDVRLQVFLDALWVSQPSDDLCIPPGLQLALYVTCYWMKHAEPEPKPEFFGAMLVGLVFGELSRDSVTEKAEASELKRLKNMKSRKEKTPLDLEAAHAYSQWQCIMKDSISLNQLLANPVPEPEYACLYSGLFLHSVVQELRRGISPDSLLAGAPSAVKLYRNLRKAVELQLTSDVVLRLGFIEKQAQCPIHHDPIDDLTEMYEHLQCEEEEDDEDLQRTGKKGKGRKPGDEIYEQTCKIRTRHRKRSGTKDPKSKKYEHAWESQN